jgi:hypothetical protein
LLDDGRGQDLAALRRVGDPCGDDHVPAVEVAFLADRLARMEPDAQPDRPVGVSAEIALDGVLDGARALERAARARERDHEAVALRLDLEPLERLDLLAHQQVVDP